MSRFLPRTPHPVLRAALATLLFTVFASVSRPQSANTDTQRPDGSMLSRVGDDLLGVSDFFETVLPGTLKKYNLLLDFSPKFGDVRNREFIRYPVGVRYGLAQDWEVYGGLTVFSPNPFNHGNDFRWGPGELRLGVRHNTPNGFVFYNRATLGLETRMPLGEPPVDLIDGYTHLKPYLTASRDLHWPDTQFYTTFSYDRSIGTPGRDRPISPKVIRQHIAQVAPGFLYKPGEYGWFTEYEFRHLDEDVGYRLSHGFRLGLIWDVPRAKSQHWKLPGKWQIEIAGRIIKEEGRSLNPGIVTRIQVRTSLREVFNREKLRQNSR